MVAAAQVDQRDGGGHAGTQHAQPDRRATAEQNAVSAVEGVEIERPVAGDRRCRKIVISCGSSAARLGGVVGVRRQYCPSLVVIEQFSLLTRNRLDACTEPTSDCEIGVTVSDHGM